MTINISENTPRYISRNVLQKRKKYDGKKSFIQKEKNTLIKLDFHPFRFKFIISKFVPGLIPLQIFSEACCTTQMTFWSNKILKVIYKHMKNTTFVGRIKYFQSTFFTSHQCFFFAGSSTSLFLCLVFTPFRGWSSFQGNQLIQEAASTSNTILDS